MTSTSLRKSFPARTELFGPMEKAFDDFFNGFFKTDFFVNSDLRGASNYPKMDIIEENDKWIIEAAIPGVKEQDLKIEISERESTIYNYPNPLRTILTISGVMQDRQKYKNESYSIKELKRSAFTRQIYLPNYVKGSPEAVLENGILTLTWQIEKKQEIKPNRIQVQVKKVD